MPKLLALCLLAVLGSVGCTHQVRPDPAPLTGQPSPLALRARYFISPEQRSRVDSDNYYALGLSNTWNIEIGEALAASFPQMLGTVFHSVKEASSAEDIGDADVLIVPRIEAFDVSGGSFTSELKLEVRARGSDGAVLLSQQFEGMPAEGKAGTAWFAGMAGGEGALQQSAAYAFEDVMPKIAHKLREVFTAAAPSPPLSLR